MELTMEARLDMIAAGHRRWQERERAKLAALFAGSARKTRRADVVESAEGFGVLAFDEVCP